MQLGTHLETLLADLRAFAAGDEQSAPVAERLTAALRSSLGLRLLDILGEAALELSERMPNGHVEVRLAGTEPTLVFVEEEAAEAPPATGDDAMSARISLRLPEPLKGRIEELAAREGVSVNTWLVRALQRSVTAQPRRTIGSRLTGYGRS
jgi:hypothetical protein